MGVQNREMLLNSISLSSFCVAAGFKSLEVSDSKQILVETMENTSEDQRAKFLLSSP